jgi:hypothetical protein
LAIFHLPRYCLGCPEPVANNLYVLLWGTDSAFALLLKAVQDENRCLEPDSVNSAVSSIRIVFNYLQYTGAAKSFQNLGGVVPLSALSKMKCMSKKLPNRHWKRHQISFTAS